MENRFGGGGFQFYEPGKSGWSHATPFEGTNLHNWMAEFEKQGYYGNWLGKQGMLGSDVKSDFGRSLYNRFEQGYKANQFENPDLKWQDYLGSYQNKFKDVAASYDPESRGESRSQYVGGARWLPRSG